MAPSTDAGRQTAREFAQSFLDEAFADATSMLSEAGRDAVAEVAPEEFQPGEQDAESALEEFWYGLYGQYGASRGVGAVDASGDGLTVELQFADGSHDLDIAVADGEVTDFELASEYTPPAYADSDAFTEHEVTVDGGDVDLEGVLALPDGDGPFPGVLLVHGAGIHDPDGSAANSKILKDFAWGLASEGVATLRYEKRLRDHDVDPDEFTFDTVVVDDAVAAVDELAAANGIAEESLFVVGHSQGGWVGPRVAARRGDIAGVVNLDGTPNPGIDEEMLGFLPYSIEPNGDLDEAQEAELAEKRKLFERVAAGEYDPDEEVLGKPGRWHDSIDDLDPIGTIQATETPVFAAKAGRCDPDVQPEIADRHQQTLETWETAELPTGSRVEFYEDVGHYLQEGHEPTTGAHLYFADNAEGHIVADVAEWLHGRADA